MSSKADDFDVRYRDAGETGGIERGRWGASGGYGVTSYGVTGSAGNIDYDLGYDANGWDTNGFRSPEADYLDTPESAAASAQAAANDSASRYATVEPGCRSSRSATSPASSRDLPTPEGPCTTSGEIPSRSPRAKACAAAMASSFSGPLK